MCPRFEQVRLDFAVPRPSELAGHRADVLRASPEDWPPTPSEYRALLAERRGGSAGDLAAGSVIRTPELRQVRAPAPRNDANTPDDGLIRR